MDEPPYSMLDKVVHKLTEDGASAILVVPNWPHRLWWRRLQGMVFFPRGHRVVGDSWDLLTEWEGAEDSPTWEPPGNFVHRYSSEFVKYCDDHRVKFDLMKHLATQEPREVNRVVCKFGRWPYVREDYAVRREVFEDILVGLGVPGPPVDAFATEANHLFSVWWGPGGEH